MKACFFERHGGVDVLQYGDTADPVPAENEVLVRVKAAACNYNDIWAREGLDGLKIHLPHISGSDAAGVVESAAPGGDFRPGDEVIIYPFFSCQTCIACARGEGYFCPKNQIWGFTTGPMKGAFGELCAVPVHSLIRKLPGLSWVDAATLPVLGLSVWRMLVKRASVRRGDVVLIWGAGSGIGSFAVQVVKHYGGKAIAVTRGAERLQYAHDLGADHVIDRDVHDVEKEVARITERRGVDLVFEHTGKATWPISVRTLRHGGALVTCGATSGYLAETDLRYLWNRQLTFYGSHAGSKADLMEVVHRVAEGCLMPPRSTVIPLESLADAQRMFERADFAGKLVIVP